MLKTVTLGRNAAATMAGVTFSDNTVLYRGTLDSSVRNSFNIRTLDASYFYELASKEFSLGGQKITDDTREGRLQAKVAKLTTELAALSLPRQDGQGREKWNVDDVGPLLSDEALIGGAGRLDKQGMHPVDSELGSGATRRLIVRQPVQPSTGAWQADN